MGAALRFGWLLFRGGRGFWRLPAGLVALAVAVLLMIVAVARGFDRELLDKVLRAGAHVTLSDREGGAFADWREALTHFRAEPGVRAAGARFTGDALLEASGLSFGARVLGIEATAEAELSPHLSGCLPSGDARGWCLLGSALAERLQLTRGDKLRFRGPGRELDLILHDTFSVGLYEYDLSFAYLALEDAWELFDYPPVASSLVLRLTDASDAASFARRVGGEFPGIQARGWEELNRPLVATIAIEQQVMRLVVLLAAALSLFGFALLVRLTVETRRRQLGILEAFGFSRREIRLAFLVEGVLVVVAGTLTGLLVGWLGCGLLAHLRLPLPEEMARTYAADRLPVCLQGGDVLYIALVEIVFALLISLVMTSRVMKLGAAELLRN